MRKVVQTDYGYSIENSNFHTSDKELAKAVRDELDHVDPVYCPPGECEVLELYANGKLIATQCIKCSKMEEQ
jgi:hypothetical protein